MTWFRVGGGCGIPVALKNRMNAVLNKKFGTAVDYPPNGWPDDVNLLGPLPEGTASGSIVTFSDGADVVPIKSLVVTIPPTLSGVSSVSVTQTGRNLADGTNFTRGLPSTTIGASIETITASTRYAYIGIDAKGTNYTISSVSTDTDYFNTILIYGYTNGVLSVYTNTAVNASKTVDFSACDYIRLAIGTRSASYQVPTDLTEYGTIQLELGSTAHAYEPYTAPTQYTSSLGRTIYGGVPDIVNGTAEPTNWLDDTLANLEQGSINGSTGANENANNRVRNTSAIPFPYDEIVSSYTWTIPSGYKVAIRPYDANGNFVQLPSWALAFVTQLPQDLIGQGITQMRFVLAKTDNSAITPSEMVEVGYILNKGNTAEAYSPYFEPFTFDGQEINTRLGNNTMWSEQGDMEVTYRRDIDLALQALSGSRGLMMASRPANGDQGSEESTENNIETEGEQDAR